MADGDIVASGVIEVSYAILEYTIDGKTKYDYYNSDYLFDTIEEAIQDFTDRHGG